MPVQAQKLVLPVTFVLSFLGGALILGARVGSATEQFRQMNVKISELSRRLDRFTDVAQRTSNETVAIRVELAKVAAKQEVEARDFDVRLRIFDDFVRHRIGHLPYRP